MASDIFSSYVLNPPQWIGADFCGGAPIKAHSTFLRLVLNYAAMYIAVTRNIQITALPDFLPDQSDPEQERFVWSYTIEIANLSRMRVQLVSRHWIIIDAHGRREEVRGPGVVGENPVLEPGETYRYASGCPLATPSGLMQGSYRMVTDTGETFDVEVPAFSLDSPFSKPTLN
jgi:ApaG protein